MSQSTPSILTNSTQQTASLAERIGEILSSGDVLLLQGDIGAGKSFFARSVIQSLQDNPEDVPSPTFTLVQTYETRAGEVWHADLYRLSDPSEAEELGLTEAFDDAICLIEWPDRLAGLTPASAVTLTFSTTSIEGQRHISLTGGNGDLRNRILGAMV